MHEASVLCARTLEEISGGSVPLERELLELFVTTTHADATAMQVAFADRSLERIGQLAHLIDGRSRIVGAAFLSRVCERMEWFAQTGNWPRLEQAHEQFQQEWSAVREAIRRRRS
jgi:HPt (histidine-containing phosphotransfer) domain-containing protein